MPLARGEIRSENGADWRWWSDCGGQKSFLCSNDPTVIPAREVCGVNETCILHRSKVYPAFDI